MILWLPAAISGAAALGGSLWSGLTQRRNVNKTNRANLELAKYAHAKDVEMWERMQEYNTPAKQMQRFREAGLNPNLVYGQGTPGNVDNAPSFHAPRMDYTGRPPAVDLAGVEQATHRGVMQSADRRIIGEKARQEEMETWLKDNTRHNEVQIKQLLQNRAAADVENAVADLAYNRVRNQIQELHKSFWKQGISPGDQWKVRVGVNVLRHLGIEVGDLFQGVPEEMIKQIFGD